LNLRFLLLQILQLKLLRKSSSADDTLSDDDSDFDLDDDDVGRLRLDDSVAMTTSSLYDDSSAVRLDLPDGSELPGYLDVSAVSTDVPDCHVLPDDIEIPGTGDVSASSGDVPGSDRSPGAASEVLGNGDVPAVSSDIPGENDVIIDSNCWFVANCDDDYDEPLNVNVTPASFGGLTESVSGMNPTVLPLYSSN
jgi:hypothetical protein